MFSSLQSHLFREIELDAIESFLPYNQLLIFAVTALRFIGKHISENLLCRCFRLNSGKNASIRIVVRLRQIKRTPTLSICLTAAVYVWMFCVHRRMHNHRKCSEWISPVVFIIIQSMSFYEGCNFKNSKKP